MRKIQLALFIVLISGCATYQGKVESARSSLRKGQTQKAVNELKVLADKVSDDQLVYVLDYATALQINGEYQKSNEAFLKADKLTELQDYNSISNIAAATLSSEEMIQYKGESYEKFLINTFLSINYLLLGQPDDALVEARRINDKISKFKMDKRKPYEFSPMADYLSAMVWEADQKWDDAYISYSDTYKLDPNISFLHEDLIRSSKNARRMEDYAQWKEKFPEVKEKPEWYDRKMGELVVIYQQGWGPEKKPMGGSYTFPMLVHVHSSAQDIEVQINDDPKEYRSKKVYDVEKVAMQTLKDDQASLIARRIGARAAKAVVADQIRQKNQLLGFIAEVGMVASDRADLRQWSTLPQTIQLVRVFLKPGKYKVSMQGQSSYGSPTSESFTRENIEVKPGRKTFINWRTLAY